MEIIARTNNGFMIAATKNEVNEILRSVTGKPVEDIRIGQKIPAIDYAASITKLKELNSNYEFKMICQHGDIFKKELDSFRDSVNAAASLEV